MNQTGKTMRFSVNTLQTWHSFGPQLTSTSKVNRMAKKPRKRVNIKRLNPEQRLRNAERWLRAPHAKIKDLITAYCKRYTVSSTDAYYELMELGYKDELAIQAYEKAGIEWEYKHDGYTGLDLVVPKGTKDWELPYFY
jgi:hypothetical protein